MMSVSIAFCTSNHAGESRQLLARRAAPAVAHLDEHDRVGAACRRRKAGREQHERRHGI